MGRGATARPASPSADLVDDADLRAEIQKAVDDANKAVSKAESIRTFRILPDDFEVGVELSQKMSVKRHVVGEKYGDVIDGHLPAPARGPLDDWAPLPGPVLVRQAGGSLAGSRSRPPGGVQLAELGGGAAAALEVLVADGAPVAGGPEPREHRVEAPLDAVEQQVVRRAGSAAGRRRRTGCAGRRTTG